MTDFHPKFNCKICLWTFESESELNIHDYLEHMIIKYKTVRNLPTLASWVFSSEYNSYIFSSQTKMLPDI